MKLLLIVLLFPLSVTAKDLYQIHHLSERQIQQTYALLLEDACQFADRDWTNSSFDPTAGYWGDGVSSGNEGIRTIGSMVLACGTLLKYDDSLSDSERRDLLSKSLAAIRYATTTHFTGTQKCTDRKQWGGMDRPGYKTWQSSYWAGSLAFGAWLMWDKLDPQLRQDVERVVAAQDDLLATGNPPVNLWLDTKAEENGWNVPLLCLGELMFPSNPHANLWHETALKYMMNTLCTAADTNDTSLVDGRAVKDWVLGANLQPDYTLENHGIFHPAYVGCSSYFLTQAAMYYAYAGKTIPQAANHHLMDVWQMFRTIILPWGETADPQSMDWELHGLPFIDLYGTLATRDKDPFAARMEQGSLQYLRQWQIMYHGDLTLPGSPFGITRHAINCELMSFGFLAHKIFGPSVAPLTARTANAQEEGVWDHPYLEFIEHRTAEKFASFSWKNHVMGLLMPIDDHEGNPDFIVPIANGLIGSFQVADANSRAVPLSGMRERKPALASANNLTATEHSWKKMPNGFETGGTILLDGGRLKQTLAMMSIGEQTVVYEDEVTALSNVTVRAELGLPIGIENDELTGGTRTVIDQDGKTIFDWQKPQKPAGIPGNWVNVDGRIGVVAVAGAGMTYDQASKYSPGISVCSDILYGSYSNQARRFKAGDEVAHRVAVFYVEVTPKETRKLSQACRIEEKSGVKVLRFKQPDGTVDEAPLD
jgi:hypothetical protein